MNGRFRRLSTKPIGHTRDPSVATTLCTPPPTSCVVTVTVTVSVSKQQCGRLGSLRPLFKVV